jgi:hypothetical protein
VEVVLEESKSFGTQVRTFEAPETRDDESKDEYLEEAPAISLARVPSFVLNVSQMQLHLDEDSEERRTREAIRRGIASADERSNVSVTSINFLTSDSTRDEESDLDEDYSEADEDVESDDEYIEPSKKKKSRVQKIFARFRKDKRGFAV